MREIVAEDGAWSSQDFAPELDRLEGEVISLDAYRDAVNAGRKTLPDVARDDADPVVEKWTGHVMEYAVKMPGRFATELAAIANEAEAMDGATPASVVAAISAKLDALASSVTRYAEPLWGAGQEGYSAQLKERAIKIVWILDAGAQHCGDCEQLAADSPYDEPPTYPGAGDTECLDRCRCWMSAEDASWAEAMDEAA